ncbi:hypothetical protein [Sphingomonas cavernae]|uniref:hypothetical protein n=1 Tax=Sphingomonas cavernae TaxID=2320861 RepID=UPI001EE4F1D5|nr:hypothetical protein [Sphingomonas cavernae]
MGACLLLTACGGQGAGEDAGAADAGRIECAAAGESAFRSDCTVERSKDDAGALILTVSHPDGAFRRLRVVDDGRGVVAADGAEEAQVSVIAGGGIEVSLAGERYRLPATIKGQ